MVKLYLNDDKPRYWKPIDRILDWLCARNENSSKVLEVGPGNCPLRISTDLPKYDQVDLDSQLFPYETNNFDFVYSRHVLGRHSKSRFCF